MAQDERFVISDEFRRYVKQNLNRFAGEILMLASHPSVSATNQGIEECSAVVEKMMRDLGITTRVLRINGASPLVFGEMKSAVSDRTILFYNHYDVQPVEPLDEWKSPPFKPEIRGGRIFGRGVSDDKGELVSRLKVLETFVALQGHVPCNFKFCFDGEEEVGSPHLEQYVERHAELFRADAVFWEWGGVDEGSRPVVQLGVKGNLVMELALKTMTKDAHGKTSAALPSAAWRMVHFLSQIRDQKGRITIPGWYDDVEKLTLEEAKVVEDEPFDADEYLRIYGAKGFLAGMSAEEARMALATSPTANIQGIWGGYTGPGSKGIVPAEVHCKMNFQLVQNQDPDRLFGLLGQFMRSTGNSDIEVLWHRGEPAARTSHKNRFAQSCIQAGKRIYGRESIIRHSASGSGPMYVIVKKYKIPAVSIGVSAPDSGMHAPNENLRIDLLEKGILWIAETIEEYVGSEGDNAGDRSKEPGARALKRGGSDDPSFRQVGLSRFNR